MVGGNPAGQGGGIYVNAGAGLTLADTTITGNTAVGTGMGASVRSADAYGGGIYSSGP